MLDVSVHGVALIKVSTGILDPAEFYAVFMHGVLQPTRFQNWNTARAMFERTCERELEIA